MRLFAPPIPEGPDLAQAIERYDQELAFLDDQLGALFELLKQHNLFDDSLIIVTSDHGEAFGEHGHLQHSNSVYCEEVAVPLIVRYPGGGIRGIEREPASLVRLTPDILRFVGIHSDARVAFRQLTDESTPVVAEMHFAEPMAATGAQWVTRCVYTDQALKVITAPTPEGTTELYDTLNDPRESHPLPIGMAEHERVVQWATDWLVDWAAEVLSCQGPAGPPARMDAEVIRQLRSLGYLD